MKPTTDDHDLHRLAQARPSAAARFIAGALTPANVVLALMAYVAITHSTTTWDGLKWWAIALVLVVGLPYAILFRAIRTGRVSDRQVVRRSQRPWLFAAASACVAAAIAVLWVAGAPRPLTSLIITMLAGLVSMGALTLAWKASMHLAVAAGATAVLAIENPLAGAVALVLLPILAWARWRDGRHSWAQLIGGAVVGGTVAAAVYSALT